MIEGILIGLTSSSDRAGARPAPPSKTGPRRAPSARPHHQLTAGRAAGNRRTLPSLYR